MTLFGVSTATDDMEAHLMTVLTAQELADRISGNALSLEYGVRPWYDMTGLWVAVECLALESSRFMASIDQFADQSGWYRSHVQEPDCDKPVTMYEPKQPMPTTKPAKLFHATRVENVDGILAQGIKLSERSRTWSNRAYFTPRAFFGITLADARDVIKSLINGGPADRAEIELTEILLDEFEVFAVAPTDRPYYLDVMSPPSVWTDLPVANSEVRLIDGWREQMLAL